MGFTNQRKSTLLFTFAYRAAQAGYKVLLVPRECSVDDAYLKLVWLHAAATGRAAELPALADALDSRHAREKHAEVIRQLGEDMRANDINVRIEALSDMGSIKAAVEAHVDNPYDLLAIDYIGHLDTPGHRDEKEGMKAAFRAAGMLQDYNDGRGLVVGIDAIQANKKAADAAGAPDAVFDRGIYTAGYVGAINEYTFAGHDLDALIGVWSGDGLREHRLARIWWSEVAQALLRAVLHGYR